MTAALIEQVHEVGGKILLSRSLSADERSWIIEHEAAVEATIALRRNANGFLVKFPAAIEQLFAMSPILSLDLETTGLTPQSEPCEVKKSTSIGTETFAAYLAKNPKSKVDSRLRVRVLAVQIPVGQRGAGEYVFDLDALDSSERERLIFAAIHEHYLVGHNIGFDLAWLLRETAARPKIILDTLVLTRQVAPDFLFRANYEIGFVDEDRAAELETFLTGPDEAKASLEAISMHLGLAISKTHQKPANWTLSILSPEHLNYVLADIQTPLKILDKLFGTLDGEEIERLIRRDHPMYIHFSRTILRCSTLRGVPFSRANAEILVATLKDEIATEAQSAFSQWKEFSPEAVAAIADVDAGVRSTVIVNAMVAHAAAHDIALPRSDNGGPSLSQKAIKLAGLQETLPAWKALSKISAAKKNIATVEKYAAFADSEDRIHPLVAWITAAGRACASEPNLLGMPRDSRVRRLIEARPGYQIVWADFAAIELRIASALAERMIDKIRAARVVQSYGQSWWMIHVLAGMHDAKAGVEVPWPAANPPDGEDVNEYRKHLPGRLARYYASKVFAKERQSLAKIFDLGLDPHLATGLDLGRRAGQINILGDVIAWLGEKTESERKELKVTYESLRQAAKATNFGLLYGQKSRGLHSYGIVSYGLTWSLADAEEARDAWFQMYCQGRSESFPVGRSKR
jgi:hypothetical protein